MLEAILGAAGNILGPAINAIGQSSANKKNRAFTREMYDRTYQDNLAFWRMQNDYNSPEQQMQRLRDAGLNPHLIYGSSSSGAAGTAGSIPTPEVKSMQYENPRWGDALGNGLQSVASIYDLEMKKAQTDNLKAQNDVIKQDAALRAAQVLLTTVNKNRGLFDLDYLKEMRSVSADTMRAILRKMTVETNVAGDRNIREAAMNSSNLMEAAERIKNMQQSRQYQSLDMQRLRANIDLLQKEGVIKDIHTKLWKNGINPNDPQWSRIIGLWFQKLADGELNLDAVQSMKKRLNDSKLDIYNFLRIITPF